MHRSRLLILSLLTFALIGVAVSPLLGQGDTVITITAPGWVSHAFNDEVFAPFEAQHPGVKVVAVDPGQDYYYPSAGEDIQKHLDGVQKYATYADVLYVDPSMASVEATRAGYFANLAPFISSDPNANTDDFFPKIWQSAQWDDGTWYIPASAYVEMMMYDAKAFDDAGVPHPSEKMTFDDFDKAVRAMTVYDKDGKVLVPGFQLYNPALMFYGFSGKQPFYDSSTSPSVPKFDNPDLASFFEGWKALGKDTSVTGSFDYDKMRFQYGSPWRTNGLGNDGTAQWQSTFLPGDIASLSIEGFAVSGGSINPELAYELANFASTSPEIVDSFGGDTPARRSMIDPSTSRTKDYQSLFEEAMDKAVPISELRFADYVEAAVNKQNPDGTPVDIPNAIQDAEVTATKALETASARKGSAALYVTTPVPTPSLSDGQVVIRFGMGVDMSANRDAWNGIVSNFLAANPTIGNIDMVTDFFEQKDLEKLDCFYQPFNQVPSMDLQNFYSLDPFVDADANFDRSDFIGNVLDQVTRDNHIWAYPIMIQPSIMWYDSDLFSKAGLPSPEQGWTVDAFKDALQTLKPMLDKPNDPVFVPGTYGDTYLLMLIAAYGGIPYDYRTTPPTINYTDAATVDAIRQVLDMAKSGLIGYQSLFGRGAFIVPDKVTLTDDVFSTDNYHLQSRTSADGTPSLKLANFPHGSQYTPVAYNVGAAYIQKHAQNPDACYQWIAEIAKRPDLLNGMPARVSQVSDPTITTSQGEDISAMYQAFMDTFQNPNAVSFPGPYGAPDSSFNSFVEPLWLNRAFDRYVLNNGDLDKELADAQTFTQGYRECASTIPEMNAAQLTTDETANAYYKQFADCAIQVDPTMKEQFSYLYSSK